MPAEDYEYTGNGAAILENASLEFIQTADAVLGTEETGVPDGPYNAQLWKLLQNDFAIVAYLFALLSRTTGVEAGVAPAVDTIVLPLIGAPGAPVGGVLHVALFEDFEVTYKFNGTSGLWEEQGRQAKVFTAVAFHRATVEVASTTGNDNVSFNIPTVDDGAVVVAFTLADLKICYLENLDAGAAFLGTVGGLINQGGGVIRTVLSGDPVDGADYKLVAIFEKLIIS